MKAVDGGPNDFSGQTVLITGAAGGLGSAIAADFYASGARVALADIDREGMERFAGRQDFDRSRARIFPMDVGDERAVRSGIEEITEDLGAVSILINCAGVCALTSFPELSLEEWDRTLRINLTGAFLCMRYVSPGMIEAKRGRIINIGSLAGRSGGIFVSAAYSASKAGLGGLTKAAARQLAPYAITVNCIAPGTLETEMTAGWDVKSLDAIRRQTPLGRLGRVEDVAGAVRYLASQEARFLTGVTLDVNGGLFIAPG